MSRAAITLVKLATPALTIGGITAAGVSKGLAEMIVRSGGYVDARDAYLAESKPSISLATADLSALASIGIEGVEVTTADTYWHVKGSYAGRLSGSNHTKVSLAKAYGLPRSIQAAKRGNASLTIDLLGISADGEASPLSVTASQALPAGSVADKVYSAGHVDLAGTDFDLEDCSVDFGLDAKTEGMRQYDEEAWLDGRAPSIQFNTTDTDAFSLSSVGGAGHVYFRRRQGQTVFYPDSASQHIKLSWTKSLIVVGESTGDDSVGIPVTIKPLWDNNPSNAVIVVATASAIT